MVTNMVVTCHQWNRPQMLNDNDDDDRHNHNGEKTIV